MEPLTLGLLGLFLVSAATIIRRFTSPERKKMHVVGARHGAKPVVRVSIPADAKVAPRVTGAAMSWVPPVPHGETRELTAVGQ